MTRNPLNRIKRLRIRFLIERLTHAKISRCAFTLVEVLVVVASIGITLGLFVPTIRKKPETENAFSQVVAMSVLQMEEGMVIPAEVPTK